MLSFITFHVWRSILIIVIITNPSEINIESIVLNKPHGHLSQLYNFRIDINSYCTCWKQSQFPWINKNTICRDISQKMKMTLCTNDSSIVLPLNCITIIDVTTTITRCSASSKLNYSNCIIAKSHNVNLNLWSLPV